MIPDAVEDWPVWMNVLVLGVHLRVLGKVSLRLEVILELVDDGSGRAEISVVGLDFGSLFEAALRLQVVLDGSDNVRATGRLGLVRSSRLALIGQWSFSQTQAGRAAEVGPGFTTVAKEFHLWCSLPVSIVGQEGSGSGHVGVGAGADASGN